MSLEWFIARRYLSSRDGRRLALLPLIATAGIAVGVMALVVVTSVMNGLQDDLRSKILAVTPQVAITLRDHPEGMPGWEEVLRRARKVEGVTAAAPFVLSDVVVANRAGYVSGGVLRGIATARAGPPVSDIARRVARGELQLGETRSGRPALLVGSALADRLGVVPGDLVDLVAAGGPVVSPLLGFQATPGEFEVTGLFETGLYAFDQAYLYTTTAAAAEVARLGRSVTGIELDTRDPMRADRVVRRLENALGPSYRVEGWQAVNASLFSALTLEKIAMSFVLLLIVVVAAFGIVSLLVMAVNEKRREIGILRSMGLRSEQVRRVFVLQGAVIGAIGSALGLGAGLLVGWTLRRLPIVNVSNDALGLDRLPVAFDRFDIALIVVTSLAVALVATLHPSRLAANLSPVDAIRES